MRYVELEVTVVPESVCSWRIDQRSEVPPVFIVVPCVCFGTPQSACVICTSVFSLALILESAQSLGALTVYGIGIS